MNDDVKNIVTVYMADMHNDLGRRIRAENEQWFSTVNQIINQSWRRHQFWLRASQTRAAKPRKVKA